MKRSEVDFAFLILDEPHPTTITQKLFFRHFFITKHFKRKARLLRRAFARFCCVLSIWVSGLLAAGYPVRPARLATTASNSRGLIGFGT